jgi:hypothetical protein
MIQISKLVNCAIDDGIIGLVDPLHGPVRPSKSLVAYTSKYP